MTGRIELREVGPRDGLQNESATVPTPTKVAFVERLAAARLPYVEATSFVSPKWIPQLADGPDVARGLKKRPGTSYAALVPNLKGYEAFRAAGTLDVAAVFMSATETHNRKNIAKSIGDTFPVLREVVEAARRDGFRARGYVSVVFGCPYEGQTSLENVLRVTRELLAMGCEEISLGDTVGYANPRQVREVLARVFELGPPGRFSLHFHDTRGTALANVLAALEQGVAVVDSAAGGTGGCPYAPGASGNLATEDLLYMLQGMGIETGVDIGAVAAASRALAATLGRPLPSRYLQAGPPR
ncbi:MAG TPA: hydroxymethylglutaryl-CoA lyase, partial [Planctomycetota bacterium]|nr:hydroxymethylglutaryl-CoA lyase [Planctomycetota bacterium]